MLKIAKITPLFKSSDAGNVTNYRPSSSDSIFSNILERIMHNRIHKHLRKNNLLSDKQFGFQLNNPTEHATANPLLMIFLVLLREENKYYGYLLICLKRFILWITKFGFQVRTL